MLARLKYSKSVLCGVVALLIWPAILLHAQTPSKDQITASYLYNFAKNIEWPEEEKIGQFRIGLYRTDNPALYDALLYLQKNAKIRNMSISVSLVNSIKSLSKYHLIYTEQNSNAVVEDIYSVIDGSSTLLVTEQYANKQLVMINLIPTQERKLIFEVNKSNIINQGLKPLPELILNGGTEIDVAKLFREGQASLIAVQKKLKMREKTLRKLSENIEQQEKQNQELERRLQELDRNIKSSRTLIAKQVDQLDSQKVEIEKGKQLLVERNKELEKQTQLLSVSQEKLNTIQSEIDLREKRLSELNEKISLQESEIKEQQGEIVQLDELVASQQTALRYLWAASVLGFLLVITAIAAYIVKRRDNLRLEAHSRDLQMARDRLAIAKRKAEDASQAKSEFLSLMSHELRTPLQAIIGYTDVVIEELKFDGLQSHVDDLKRVISNSERLLKLINGVLDLAKIESGRMELYLTEVKLSTLADEAIGSVKPQLEKNQNQLKLDIDDGSTSPVADPEKLLHIMINLLSNATKFCNSGTISMVVKNQDNLIYISVEDTGIGMTPEQQAKVFDRFRQADSSTTRNFQGSGLGLSISRQFCELMGGTIYLESEINVGSKFIVKIPLPIDSPPEIDNENGDENGMDSVTDNSTADENSGPAILMIDDDPAFLDIMKRAMTGDGYKVYTADCAEDGMKIAKTNSPQLITLDLMLPDEHGWLLFEKIKSDKQLQDIPVIIISIIDGRKQGKGKELQADDYLTKPIGREAFKKAVKKLVPINK